MKIKKCSFDYDSTLSVKSVQKFVKRLLKEGVEVWIVTSRPSKKFNSPNFNNDLYEVAKSLGIKKEHIHFTHYVDKWFFLKDRGFLFHLDDDTIELELLEEHTNVIPICHYDWGIKYGGKKEWKNKCLKILNLEI